MDEEGLGRRRRREQITVAAMLLIYCRAHHRRDEAESSAKGLCEDCAALQSYALRRLTRCVFRESKPTCANCRVHCYSAAMQEKIRVVMRYAGPRMLWRHPYLALRHLVDGQRHAPGLEEAVAQHRKR